MHHADRARLVDLQPAHAQGGVPLVTVATDQSPLNLSNQFGVPAGIAINQAGDFAFVGSGDTALFFRAAGASAAARLLQIDDEVPGFPGSQILLFSPELGLNFSHSLLFGVRFTGADNLPHAALLIYDGTSYHTAVSSDGVAPGSSGATYGLNLTPGSIDDSGDINFAAVPTGINITSTTFFIVASGGSAVRVVGLNDTPPASCTWCSATGSVPPGGFFVGVPGSAVIFEGISSVPKLNVKGQMLLSLWGGLFIGGKDGGFSVVPMAGTGVCGPQPTGTGLITIGTGSITLGGNRAFLNNSGVVAFTNPSSTGGTICVAPAGGGLPTAATTAGDPAPASLGGTIASPDVLGLDDSGDIVFQSPVSGGSITTFALLRHHSSSGQSDVVAYSCEQAPGTNGSLFSIVPAPLSWAPGSGCVVPSEFNGVSIASDASVSFNAFLTSGESGIYRQSGSGAPELISLEPNGSSTFSALPPGVSVGSISTGSFSRTGQTEILNNGSVFFASYLTGVAADFAVQLGTPGNVKSLMSTADLLPSGARIILGSAPPQAAGHFVAFTAQPAAGRTNLLESDLTSGTITRVVSENDPALATAGGPSGNTVLAPNFFLNASGQVAFETVGANAAFQIGVVIFGGSPPVNAAWLDLPHNCGAIYLWAPSGGVKKIVAAGDAAPTQSQKFSCVDLNETSPSPLNAAGEVAFSAPSPYGAVVACSLCDPGLNPPGVVNGDFLYSAAGTISEVAAANDTLPGQSLPPSLVPALSVPVNSAGQAAFGAELGTTTWGFYLQNGATTQKVMANGDSVPGTSDTFGFPHFIAGLSDNGTLAFTAATSAADGLFLAPAGGAIQTLALDGGAAPVPGGGTFSFVPPAVTPPPGSFSVSINSLKNFAAINGESDVAFGASIAGGSANSGYFRVLQSGPAAGTVQSVAWQGESVPGGGTLNTIAIPNIVLANLGVGANFSLGPDGAFGFVNTFTTSAGLRQGIFVTRPNGTLVKVAAEGDFVPGGGILTSLSMSSKLAGGDAGRFAFAAAIAGGNARRAIFVTAIPPGPASTTTTLGQLQNPAVAQQPVMLTATVTSLSAGVPTGAVTFFANGISLGSGTLNPSGQATITASSLNAGQTSVLAQYAGDTHFAPGDSTPLSMVVVGFAPPPTHLTVTHGQSLVIPLTLFAPAGSAMGFTLSCSGLPAYAACTFDTNPVTPGPSGTTVHLTLTTMAGSNLPPLRPRRRPPVLPGFGLAALLVGALFAASAFRRRQAARWRLASWACLATLAVALAIGGCGATGYSSSTPAAPATPVGPATFVVTGTSGATTISANLTVNVQ